jgi:hypothetical protein
MNKGFSGKKRLLRNPVTFGPGQFLSMPIAINRRKTGRNIPLLAGTNSLYANFGQYLANHVALHGLIQRR